MHRLLAEEAEQILALFDGWGQTAAASAGTSPGRQALPAASPASEVGPQAVPWVEYRPNSIWIYDTRHFTACGMAVLIIQDLVSRKWITQIVSSEETSTQVELAFTAVRRHNGRDAAMPRCRDAAIGVACRTTST